jgi:RNA polymerase sigma-70 factor (ECF subfamily)
MASTFEHFFSGEVLFPTNEPIELSNSRAVYDENRHRVYALCFWMTDNELEAEKLAERTFNRAFRRESEPSPEAVDRALILELRKLMPIGNLTLDCACCSQVVQARRNTRRVDLERAVVQLPPTERLVFLMYDVEGYAHERIARCLTLTDAQSRQALHQARLRIRELLAAMNP